MDILILGGGAAGLAAAMAIGRMGQTALVVDDNRPRNAPAAHMNNFPSRDGMNPAAWREQVRTELQKYESIAFQPGTIVDLKKAEGHFVAQISDGSVKQFRKVILANGIQDRLSNLDGFEQLWGKCIFHCTYCHGFEVRGRRLGLVANGPFAKHMLPMIYALSKDVMLFTNGPADLDAEFRKSLEKNLVGLVEGPIVSLSRDGEKLCAVEVAGRKIERQALFWAPVLPFQPKSLLGDQLGCERHEMGFYKVDSFGKTTIAGVFAAGDTSTGMHSVLAAAAAGQVAGAAAVSELLSENLYRNSKY